MSSVISHSLARTTGTNVQIPRCLYQLFKMLSFLFKFFWRGSTPDTYLVMKPLLRNNNDATMVRVENPKSQLLRLQ